MSKAKYSEEEVVQRDSCVFYKSWLEAVEILDDAEEQRQLLLVVLNYAFCGVADDSKLSPGARAVFKVIVPQIDANNQRYINSRKGGASKGAVRNPYGRKGKQEITDGNQSDCPDSDVYVSGNVSEDVSGNVSENGVASSAPSLEAIKKYSKEHNMKSDPTQFYNYYNSVGWKRGNTPITNWQSLLDGWETHGKQMRQEKKKGTDWSPTYYPADDDPDYYDK